MKNFNKFIEERKNTLDYKIEKAKLDFILNISKVILDLNISKSELAEKMGTSKAYITKILQGDANFTIESMVKICAAVDGELETCIFLEKTNSHIDKKNRYEKNNSCEWITPNHNISTVQTISAEKIHDSSICVIPVLIRNDNWEKANHQGG